MSRDRSGDSSRKLISGEEVSANTLAEAQRIIRENFDPDATIEIHAVECAGEPCTCEPEFIRADEFAPRGAA